jgi:hypothetical protein
MQFNPKGLIVPAAGALLVVLAFKTGAAAGFDAILGIAWGLVWAVSSKRRLTNRSNQ